MRVFGVTGGAIPPGLARRAGVLLRFAAGAGCHAAPRPDGNSTEVPPESRGAAGRRRSVAASGARWQ